MASTADSDAVRVDLDLQPTTETSDATRDATARLNAQVVTPIRGARPPAKRVGAPYDEPVLIYTTQESTEAPAEPSCGGRSKSKALLLAAFCAIGLALGLSISFDTTRSSFSTPTTTLTMSTSSLTPTTSRTPTPTTASPTTPTPTPTTPVPTTPTPSVSTIAMMTTIAPLTSIVVSSTGAIYLAHDSAILTVTAQNPTGTLFAGAFTGGLADGFRTNARFAGITGLALNSAGDLIITDTANHRIRKLTMSTDNVATIAGNGQTSAMDGPAASAGTGTPTDVAVDRDDNIYVYSSASGRIQQLIVSTDEVKTLPFVVTGASPLQLVVSPFGQIFFGQDVQIDTLPSYTNTASSFMAGGAANMAGYADGLGASARFAQIADMVYSRTGNEIYIADKTNHCIRKLRISDQQVTTVAGLCGMGGGAFADGTLTNARFTEPSALTLGPNGELYVVDGSIAAYRVRKIIL